jgi:hypothetical protein
MKAKLFTRSSRGKKRRGDKKVRPNNHITTVEFVNYNASAENITKK